MHSSRRTWRVRGVPREFDKTRLALVLRRHQDLRCLEDETTEAIKTCGNGATVFTLAPDIRFSEQIATVRFRTLPSRLQALGTSRQLHIKITDPEDPTERAERPEDSVVTVKVTLDEHFHGITTLVSPSADEEHLFDVLAISGLGSHAFGSFVHKEDENMWLVESLPRELPSARVLIYGYESGLQHSNSLVQLDDLANPLQIAISQLLRSGTRKPLLLIGHSLGGLLVKQALILMGEFEFESELLDMIIAVLLFGVPNDGMDIASLVPMVHDRPNRSLLESLNAMNSQDLRRQRRQFSSILNQTECQLFCFYETELSPTAAMDPDTGHYKMSGPRRCLVSQPSATSCLPLGVSTDHAVAIHRTHSDLVKFASHDSEYSKVAYVLRRIQQTCTNHGIRDKKARSLQNRRQLQMESSAAIAATRLIDEAHLTKSDKRPVDDIVQVMPPKRPRTDSHAISMEDKPVQSYGGNAHAPPSPNVMEHYGQSLVEKLYFSKIDERLTHLIAAQGTTCRWFLGTPEYLSWRDDSQHREHGGFLWIKGHPGTGKSTLIKFLFEEAKRNVKDAASQIMASFFFLARGTVEEKTATGLYRSLLHQLFQKASDLQGSLDWMTTDGAKIIQRDGWHEEALKQTFMHAIRRVGSRKLTIFVDALDECDEKQAGGMVFFFEELCELATEEKVLLKICFSSRHYPTVIIQKGIELSLEDEVGHTEDIQQFVKSRLRLGRSKQAALVRSDILDKSRGIFLWVVLVIDIINSQFPHKSISIKQIREHLKSIPPKLNDLFEMILTRDGDNLEQLALCLKWILFATRPLQPQELYFAIQHGSHNECSGYWDQEDVDLDNMKNFVRSCSKGLAEVTRNKASNVQFIHESVRHFLLGKYDGQWSGNSSNVTGNSHELLRDCCAAQLNASISQDVEIPDPLPKGSAGAQLRDTIKLRFPFVIYSVLNILHHVNSAQQNGKDQAQFLADFPLQRWIYLSNALERYDIRRHTKSASLLYILAENNFADLVLVHPRRKFYSEFENERYGAPLFAAVANNSHEACWTLLKAQTETEPLTSRLHNFCEQYFRDKSELTRPYVDFTFTRQKDVLWHLWTYCDLTVICAFLSMTQNLRKLESRDRTGRTPLSWAAGDGREHMVKLLLQEGADIESRDDSCKTPLLWAVAKGHEHVAMLLCDNGAEIEPKDHDGWTPLMIAAVFGPRAIARLLLERSAGIMSTDEQNRILSLLAADRPADGGEAEAVGAILRARACKRTLGSRAGDREDAIVRQRRSVGPEREFVAS